MSFDKKILNNINPVLEIENNNLKWKPLENFNQEPLTKEELDSVFYTSSKLKLQSKGDSSFHIYFSGKSYFTLKEVLDSIIHFENLDRTDYYDDCIFFQGFEKTGPETFRIIWTR